MGWHEETPNQGLQEIEEQQKREAIEKNIDKLTKAIEGAIPEGTKHEPVKPFVVRSFPRLVTLMRERVDFGLALYIDDDGSFRIRNRKERRAALKRHRSKNK